MKCGLSTAAPIKVVSSSTPVRAVGSLTLECYPFVEFGRLEGSLWLCYNFWVTSQRNKLLYHGRIQLWSIIYICAILFSLHLNP